MAKTAFKKSNILLTCKLNLNLRMKQMKYYIWNIALCGPESWTFCKVDQKYSESVELCCWRRMENVIWSNCVKNTRNIKWSQGRKEHLIYNKNEEG
jgi:hypothetical protein